MFGQKKLDWDSYSVKITFKILSGKINYAKNISRQLVLVTNEKFSHFIPGFFTSKVKCKYI